ncbi:hypothetical protein ACS0TY_035402 [Phlomoides rotata]
MHITPCILSLALMDFTRWLDFGNFVKPIARGQPTVYHVTGDKIPKSYVFCREKLPGVLKQLQMDLRKLMLPYTALNLKVRFI